MDGILVIVPTEMELAGVKSAFPQGVNVLVSGVGPVNISIRLMRWLMENPGPNLLLLAGICGTYLDEDHSPFFKNGEVVLAGSQSYGDLGRCTRGIIQEINIEGVPITSPIDAYPISELPLIGKKILNSNSKMAPMTTLMCSSASLDRAEIVRSRTGAKCECMEGAPFFEIAQEFKIPFVEVRAVSNIAGEPRDNWDIKGALQALNLFLRGLF